MKNLAKVFIIFLFFFPRALAVHVPPDISKSFDGWVRAYDPDEREWNDYEDNARVDEDTNEPPERCAHPCNHANANPNNGCAGGQPTCDGNVGGQDVEWYQDGAGDWWFGPPSKEGNEGGADPPDNITPPDTPTITPPPGGSATIKGFAITGPTQYMYTCANLVALKTCIDNPASPSCADVPGAKSFVSGTVFYKGGNYPAQLKQTTAAGVTYSNVKSNVVQYITASHPSNYYSPYLSCHSSNLYPTWVEGNSSYIYPDETTTYIVGLGPVFPWLQVQGGGNTFASTIYSLMPLLITPSLLFDTTAAPVQPGIVSMQYDLSDSIGSVGGLNISSTNWNSNNATTGKDWYPFFVNRLAQATKTPYPGTGGKPPAIAGQSYSVYTTASNAIKELTINTPWTIGTNEKLIMIVDGNLDIRAPITITGNGFVAFVVKNDILVNSSVGTTWNSTTPVVEGVYIAGGTIKTGLSTDIATERFVGKGMFAANAILTQRNLITAGRNRDTSADLFLYNPAFLVTMPDILQDVSYSWQEVAP